MLLIGVMLVGGNLYETLRRSTIPLALDGEVTDIELLQEKHPGIDDVHLVHMEDRTLHVDASVAERVTVGDSLHKSAWSTSLVVGSNELRLEPSRDFRGMLVVMVIVVLICGFLVLMPRRLPEERP